MAAHAATPDGRQDSMIQPQNAPELKPSADVTAQRIAHVHAEALFAAAQKQGNLEEVLGEMRGLIAEVFVADPRLEIFFSSAAAGRDARRDVIERVFQGRVSATFHAFLQVLNHHERLDLLSPIARELREMYDAHVTRARVYVTTAAPLPEDQVKSIEMELRERLKKEPLLVLKVDPEILGGMKVRIGDLQYDASIRTRIEHLRNQILERSSHEIQSRRDRFSSAN